MAAKEAEKLAAVATKEAEKEQKEYVHHYLEYLVYALTILFFKCVHHLSSTYDTHSPNDRYTRQQALKAKDKEKLAAAASKAAASASKAADGKKSK